MKYLFIFLMLFSGCATTGKLESKMQQVVGQNINNVIDSYGPPSQTFTKPNGQVVYTLNGNSTAIAENYFGNVAVVNYYCNQSYVTNKDGIVISWQHQGNHCKSH